MTVPDHLSNQRDQMESDSLTTEVIRPRISVVSLVCKTNGVEEPREITSQRIRDYATERRLSPFAIPCYLNHSKLGQPTPEFLTPA